MLSPDRADPGEPYTPCKEDSSVVSKSFFIFPKFISIPRLRNQDAGVFYFCYYKKIRSHLNQKQFNYQSLNMSLKVKSSV